MIVKSNHLEYETLCLLFKSQFFFSHYTTMYSLYITLAIMLCPAHGVDNSNKCLDGWTDENTQEKYCFLFKKTCICLWHVT